MRPTLRPRGAVVSAVPPNVHAMATPTTTEISERDRAILEFERSWWKFEGAKESAVREKFDLTLVRYYQLLNAIIDQPAALEADAMTVRRLQRMRDLRARQRSLRRRSS